jgi:hypothetical protein
LPRTSARNQVIQSGSGSGVGDDGHVRVQLQRAGWERKVDRAAQRLKK